MYHIIDSQTSTDYTVKNSVQETIALSMKSTTLDVRNYTNRTLKQQIESKNQNL